MTKSYILALLGLLLLLLLSACSSSPAPPSTSATSITFEEVGTKNNIVLLVLTSPSFADTPFPYQDVATKLRNDWQDKNIVAVHVYDNREAPEHRLAQWDILTTLSDEELSAAQALEYPHFRVWYDPRKDEVTFFAGDVNRTTYTVVKFTS